MKIQGVAKFVIDPFKLSLETWPPSPSLTDIHILVEACVCSGELCHWEVTFSFWFCFSKYQIVFKCLRPKCSKSLLLLRKNQWWLIHKFLLLISGSTSHITPVAPTGEKLTVQRRDATFLTVSDLPMQLSKQLQVMLHINQGTGDVLKRSSPNFEQNHYDFTLEMEVIRSCEG